MPYIKKRGITYGGFPNATVGSKEVSATVPSSIKQLVRVGGTQEFAPVTIPEAVKFSEGGSLDTTVNSIATIESSSTASKAYAVGDFLVSSGQLYTVIADIAIGETFVVDTNIEATSVGLELSELKAGLNNLIKYKDVTATISNTSNVPTGDVNLSADDVLIVSVVETGTPSAAHIFLPYFATSKAYGIHVLKSDMSTASGNVKIRIYYIERSAVD